jgi:hypothetical protein
MSRGKSNKSGLSTAKKMMSFVHRMLVGSILLRQGVEGFLPSGASLPQYSSSRRPTFISGGQSDAKQSDDAVDVYTPDVKGGRVKNLENHIRYIDQS